MIRRCHGNHRTGTSLLCGADFSRYRVVLSLIYVGIQLKQNTRAVRLTTMESVLQQFREHEALVCQSSEPADIFWRGHEDPSALKGQEVMRYHQLSNYYYKSFENAYFQYRDGVLDE